MVRATSRVGVVFGAGAPSDSRQGDNVARLTPPHRAVGTIKRHLHNIYGKLDVNNCTRAMARAGTGCAGRLSAPRQIAQHVTARASSCAARDVHWSMLLQTNVALHAWPLSRRNGWPRRINGPLEHLRYGSRRIRFQF
jgi:hypothetical protein